MFLSLIENDLGFFQINGENNNTNQSNGINEKRWHLCNLREESFARGAVGKSILRKTDQFSYDFGKKQNFFVKSIWGFFTTFPVSTLYYKSI